jgi:hypothetical protein
MMQSTVCGFSLSNIFQFDDCFFTVDNFARLTDHTFQDQEKITASVSRYLDEDPHVNGHTSSEYCVQKGTEFPNDMNEDEEGKFRG